MNITALKEIYPQIDIEKKHKLHIKVSEEEKIKIVEISGKLKQSESKTCVKIINTQFSVLKQKSVYYNMEEFRRKEGGFKCDLDIVMPAILYIQLLFYKEIYQSYSLGLLIRMMIDDFFEEVSEEGDELRIRESIEEHKQKLAKRYELFLEAQYNAQQINKCVVMRLSRFYLCLSDEMKTFWTKIFGGTEYLCRT